MEKYQSEYKKFIENYKAGVINGERIGEVIGRMAQYFTEANLNHASCLISYNIKARDIEQTIDAGSGKTISSSKASVLASATVESQNLIMSKAHLGNIEQAINALKAMQKGIMSEFSQSGLQ